MAAELTISAQQTRKKQIFTLQSVKNGFKNRIPLPNVRFAENSVVEFNIARCNVRQCSRFQFP